MNIQNQWHRSASIKETSSEGKAHGKNQKPLSNAIQQVTCKQAHHKQASSKTPT
jgi:hypothetical protein